MTRLFLCTPLLSLAVFLAPAASAQPVIDIGPGETFVDEAFNEVTVNLNGGSIVSNGFFGAGASLTDGVLNINAGSISDGFQNSNSVVNLNGGTVGEFFANINNTVVNVSGGTIGSFGIFNGSVANITGGQVLRFPDVLAGGTVNISGGDLFSLRLLGEDATANFFGTAFFLEGEPIDLDLGQTLEIATGTGQNFSAILADGSPFEFDLNTFGAFSGPNPDQTSPGSVINVTLVPEPSTAGLFFLAAATLGRRRRVL